MRMCTSVAFFLRSPHPTEPTPSAKLGLVGLAASQASITQCYQFDRDAAAAILAVLA